MIEKVAVIIVVATVGYRLKTFAVAETTANYAFIVATIIIIQTISVMMEIIALEIIIERIYTLAFIKMG